MKTGIEKIIDDAFHLLDECRILPALDALNRARALTEVPSRRLFLTFNIGVIYWDKLGNGIVAKTEFMAAANFEGPGRGDPPVSVLVASAAENLMLCATSYEEFDRFSSLLHSVAPDAPILAGLPPVVREMREFGDPWSSVMFRLAMNNYYRNDPALDRGRYGVAMSTYQLLLSGRRQQRLSREDWRLAVLEYCPLAIRMTMDCINRRGGDADRNSPEEVLPILSDSLPFIDEYLERFPGDEQCREMRDKALSILSSMRGRPLIPPPGTAASSGLRPISSSEYRCRRCRNAIADPTQTCPICGAPSALLPVFPGVLLLSLLTGWLLWHFLASSSLLIRGIFAVGSFFFVLCGVGPVVFQIRLALFRKDGA